MRDNVVPFERPLPFRRPCVVLSSPGSLLSGEPFYILDFYPTEADGGGRCGVWDGTDYGEALKAALSWQRDGIACHEITQVRP